MQLLSHQRPLGLQGTTRAGDVSAGGWSGARRCGSIPRQSVYSSWQGLVLFCFLSACTRSVAPASLCSFIVLLCLGEYRLDTSAFSSSIMYLASALALRHRIILLLDFHVLIRLADSAPERGRYCYGPDAFRGHFLLVLYIYRVRRLCHFP